MQALSTELEEPSQSRARQPSASARTAVAGVGGYAGGELARLLLTHPRLAETKPLLLGRIADEAPTGRMRQQQVHPQLALGGGKRQPGIAAFKWGGIRAA